MSGIYKLEEIGLEHFKRHVEECAGGSHTSVAPMGMSGPNIYLHRVGSRIQEVSLRLYCGNPELLITNNSKSFLFYGRFDVRLGLDFLAAQYFHIFQLLKSKIPLDSSEEVKLKISDNAHETEGFAMLESYKKKANL